MEYTEQEIEMLARHMWETNVFAPSWDNAAPGQREQTRSCDRQGTEPSHIQAATVRLMREAQSHVTIDVKKDGEIRLTTGALDVLLREAREQGAAEMRERAACHLEVSHEGSWQGAREIRALPLSVPS